MRKITRDRNREIKGNSSVVDRMYINTLKERWKVRHGEAQAVNVSTTSRQFLNEICRLHVMYLVPYFRFHFIESTNCSSNYFILLAPKKKTKEQKHDE